MKRLWLVRHGPTHAKTMIGWTDLPADLSDHAALARLGRALPEAPVVSSDLIRAVATADALQGARRRLPHDPGLRELHFGAWENRSFAEVEAEAPDHIRGFWEGPGTVAPPGGESLQMLGRRACAAMDRTLADHDDLIVVCHFGVILCLIQRALGLSLRETLAHRIANLSVTELHLDAAAWRAMRINHLH